MTAELSRPSKTRVDKAGRALAQAWRENGIDAIQDTEEFAVLLAYRKLWREPLLRVRRRLLSAAEREVPGSTVTQRHKREDRIVRKLARGSTRLSQLQDIGGCRVVLPTFEQAQAVYRRFLANKKNSVHRVDEYLRKAQGYGYRAIHVVLVEDGLFVETQIRTQGQQDWANAVEAIDARLGVDLKDGAADPQLMRYFTLSSEMIYLRETHQHIPPHLLADFEASRRAVVAQGFYSR